MNYLGHAWASGTDGDILTGNMIGDFVKGKKELEAYPLPIQKGIQLHRWIDTYADAHPSHIEARSIFRAEYGLYSAALVDSLFDYFIANDKSLFPTKNDLLQFSQAVYQQLEQRSHVFPETFHPFFESMRKHNWLYNYSEKEGMSRSLNGLYRRAKHMAPPEAAFAIFEENESFLGKCCASFLEDFKKNIPDELRRSHQG